MKKLAASFIVCLILTCAASASAESVPSLNLAEFTDMLGKNRGKVILVNFFATWCPPCRMEIPELVTVSQTYNNGNVLVVSLSVDEDPHAVPAFVRKMHMTYPVYMAGKDLVRAFRVSSIPHNALYDKKGKRIFSEEGMLDAETVSNMLDELLKN